jgi:hypothetical protein
MVMATFVEVPGPWTLLFPLASAVVIMIFLATVGRDRAADAVIAFYGRTRPSPAPVGAGSRLRRV